MNNVNEGPIIDMDENATGTQPNGNFRIGPDRTTADKSNFILDVDEKGPEPNDAHTFAITSGNPDGLFTIDASSGVITLAKELSEATTAIYALDVAVTDSDGLSSTGRATITLETTSVGVTGDTQAIEGTADTIMLRFVRQSDDISAPLTVQFNVRWRNLCGGNSLSAADFSPGQGLTDLTNGAVVIAAGATEATIELVAPMDADAGGGGLEAARVEVIETADYAVVRTTTDPTDPHF